MQLQGVLKVKVKVAQLCLILCNSMDYIVRGILQARILEWVPIPFSRGSSQPRDHTQVPTLQVDFFLPAEPPVNGIYSNIKENALRKERKRQISYIIYI